MSHGPNDVFIVSAARTPIGSFLGALSEQTAPQLGAAAIRGALERARLEPAQIESVYMGNVLSAGVGQAPARQAAIYAGIPESAPALTVSKVCGSGLEAVILASRTIQSGDADVMIAGGMESMSQAPYLLQRARTGYRMGHGQVVDAMLRDGLVNPYDDLHMGIAGERTAAALHITREQQDDYARGSYEKARDSQKSGKSAAEIVTVRVPQRRGGDVEVRDDEEPGRGDPAKFATLKPAFQNPGTITAANASKIDDGSAALVLASAAAVRTHNLKPLARIVTWAHHAQAPLEFPTAPATAITKALQRAQLMAADVDLYEINEAFAVVALACMQKCELDPARVNVRGGAIALGHPIGASGARILTTLLFAMHERGAKRGLATLCIGGGEANALIVERV